MEKQASPIGLSKDLSGESPRETEQAGLPPVCFSCACPLSRDEIALTKKLINRGATRFFCLSCLALRFEVGEDVLREKIAEFRAMGCTLFGPGTSP